MYIYTYFLYCISDLASPETRKVTSTVIMISAVACLLLSIISIISSKQYNFLNCDSYEAWPVDYDSKSLIRDAALLQEWIHAWQHSSRRCQSYGFEPFSADFGIGNGFLRTVLLLARSFDQGKIYRPTVDYFWALHSEGCTLNRTLFDCYLHEFSSCGIDSTNNMNRDDRHTILGMMLAPGGETVDVCVLGKMLKKPIAWVAGQFLRYIMRLRPDVSDRVKARNENVFKLVDRSTQSTISVHYRAGHPDANRHVISLDVYMNAVKLKAAELASTGRPVSVVYLASQDNDHVFINESHMQDLYPANYSYRILPPYQQLVDSSQEIEIELRMHKDVPREPFVIEFLADFQLFVRADVFIGSISTIYMIVMLMRYSKDPNRDKLWTCLINLEMMLVCEDNLELKYKLYDSLDYWWTADVAHKYGETWVGAFRGGTPW